MNNLNKIILTDVDGVLLNWEFAFKCWAEDRGYRLKAEAMEYDISDRYGITKFESKKLVQTFNESAAIGFLPPLRDAMYYVDLLHRKHGYTFHAITSLSTDPHATKLREQNLTKLFGENVFTKVLCIGTGADKDDALKPYEGSGLPWIEDKIENAELGAGMGLSAILMEHAHNMTYENPDIIKVKKWEEIYNILN